MLRPIPLGVLLASCLFRVGEAWAIRPFVTDDARVVGRGFVQLETWAQLDDSAGQHWVLPAFGPTDWLELTVGAVHGRAEGAGHSVAGPLLQGKLLLRPTRVGEGPGVALGVGTLTPAGTGFLEAPGWGGFTYVASTLAILPDEALLVHANVGGAYQSQRASNVSATAGLGAQCHLAARLYGLAEVFYGDAYSGARDLATQGGLRWIFGHHVQLDLSAGTGLAGENRRATWVTAGVRLVSAQLW